MRNWKRGPALLLAAVLSLCALSGCGRAGQGLEFTACVGGEPEELEGALLFLLDEKAASFITGVVLPIDGGFSAYSGV